MGKSVCRKNFFQRKRGNLMSEKIIPVEGAVSAAEGLRFASVAEEIMRRPLLSPSARVRAADGPHIGTLSEKRLHAAVKYYICPDESCHEKLVESLGGSDMKARRIVADILTDGQIVEVQTGGFYPLRDKIAWYFANTDHRVTVVHPVPAVKYLSWIDPQSGDIRSRNRVSKRGRVKDVSRELYWLSDFVGDPRFSIRLLLLEIEEYRMADGWGKDGKRGSNRYERFPTALLGDVTLATADDYATYFLPSDLSEKDAEGKMPVFTAAEYGRAVSVRGRPVYGVLHLLEKLGIVRVTDEMRGRSKTYIVNR